MSREFDPAFSLEEPWGDVDDSPPTNLDLDALLLRAAQWSIAESEAFPETVVSLEQMREWLKNRVAASSAR